MPPGSGPRERVGAPGFSDQIARSGEDRPLEGRGERLRLIIETQRDIAAADLELGAVMTRHREHVFRLCLSERPALDLQRHGCAGEPSRKDGQLIWTQITAAV